MMQLVVLESEEIGPGKSLNLVLSKVLKPWTPSVFVCFKWN